MFSLDSQSVYRVDAFSQMPWLEHGFGTRLSSDWPPAPLATLKQIHSDICLAAAGAPGCLGEADALVSDIPGLFVSIRTADCIPVLLVDERLHAVAAIHAGWKGTQNGIVRRAVEAMKARFGTRSEDLWGAIGPGICRECYTVGPEVAVQFQTLFPERSGMDGKTELDLKEGNRRHLVAAGVAPARIFVAGLCTKCMPELFHSHRGSGGKAGRMVSAIGIRKSAV